MENFLLVNTLLSYNTAMDSGFLPVNKPVGMSSFDVIRSFKRHSGFAGKIGHAGTLDVFASGLLMLLLGSATREFDHLQNENKQYRAGVRLGYSSSTLDVEGDLIAAPLETRPKWKEVAALLPSFLGELDQPVPAYSAAKHQGQPLYRLSRAGQAIPDKSKPVTIHSLELISYRFPLVGLDISCSSGTYIRQLTWDIFQQPGWSTFLFSLERRAIGPYTLSQAAQISDFQPSVWPNFVRAIPEP